MSANIEVKWEGLEGFRKAMEEVPPRFRENLDKFLEDNVKAMKMIAKKEVPVRTGRLRASIEYVKHGILDYSLSASAPYAVFVEFGTRRMTARPYLRPALDYIISSQDLPNRMLAVYRKAVEYMIQKRGLG